jgi:hypothetical protein
MDASYVIQAGYETGLDLNLHEKIGLTGDFSQEFHEEIGDVLGGAFGVLVSTSNVDFHNEFFSGTLTVIGFLVEVIIDMFLDHVPDAGFVLGRIYVTQTT